MDDDALNMRNWGYYEPAFKAHLGLQLMSSMSERDVKPFIPGRNAAPVMVGANGSFHPRDCLAPEGPVPMEYMRNGWMNQREKIFSTMTGSLSYSGVHETSAPQTMPILHPSESSKDESVDRVEEPAERPEGGRLKKRQAGTSPKSPKTRKNRKPTETNNGSHVQRTKAVKKSVDFVINGIDLDISSIPVPVCSCTGTPQQCYRWGCGGWQSACCTTNVSMYPLPMSTKRRGARIAGRKMSQGAFKKVLEKLAAEGYNFANPIDLKSHWARHGTNKFVTIR